VLLLYGSRVDESNSRAVSMANSCTLAGSECGTGLYMQDKAEGSRYSPITNWRNCSVWDWLAMAKRKVGYDPAMLLNLYGKAEHFVTKDIGDMTPEQVLDAIDATTRTGCIGCPVVGHDYALDRVCEWPEWSHLEPFKGLRTLYVELREHRNRLRQPAGERYKSGKLCKNQNRVGPICISARIRGLKGILAMQEESHAIADEHGRDRYWLIDEELQAAIEEAIEAKTYPRGWTGDEPLATDPGCPAADYVGPDTLQPYLF